MSCGPAGCALRDLASSTLAQIVMPQEARRDCAMWTPCLGAPRERLGCRPLAQSPKLSYRFQEREIRSRKRIRTSQREQQIALRGPRPDAVERVERGVGFSVGQRSDRVEIEVVPLEPIRQCGEVRGLLSRHAERAQP